MIQRSRVNKYKSKKVKMYGFFEKGVMEREWKEVCMELTLQSQKMHIYIFLFLAGFPKYGNGNVNLF